MAIPVAVVLDRTPYGTGPLDLTSRIDGNNLTWSSVVPGGFASCNFQLVGDFRELVKQIPYLSILRIIGDSGAVLFEGQIEDLAPTLSESSVGMRVGAYGLQNVLKETSVRAIWSKRDTSWVQMSMPPGSTIGASLIADVTSFATNIGNYDPTDPTKSGVQVASVGGVTVANLAGQVAEYVFPAGLSGLSLKGTLTVAGAESASTKWQVVWFALEGGAWGLKSSSILGGTNTFTITLSNATALRIGVRQASGAGVALSQGDLAQFSDMRILGVSGTTTEDASGGFYGDTLITSLLGAINASNSIGIGAGVIESGSDFKIDHLDASVRRQAYDILTEITSYYTREWAIWEDGLLDWTTPNLAKTGWVIPLSALTGLDLDASTQNSSHGVLILYTDAASGLTAEQSAVSSDRRNPYVLNGRVKDQLASPGFAMTSSTAQALATKVLNDIGFGPVPAAGTIRLAGETLVQHAQGNAVKAWELRAGDNVTIPELPLADVFTQDGRGECLFHIVSAEANASTGEVTLSLDSYGSKRSDVLLARLAAVTHALGG